MKYVVTDDSGDVEDTVSKALRRAWQLGQTYWQQADSESWSQNKKADETQAKFDMLVDETRAAIESFAQTLGEPVAVPDAIAGPGVVMSKQDVRDAYYAEGWNACREAMMSAVPHHPTTEKGCE